jgi:hypothetical protein
MEAPVLIVALASFAVALLPVLVAAGVSSVARAAYARGVRVPRVMRAGPWCDASPARR